MSTTQERTYGYFIGGIVIAFFGSVCFSTKAIFVKLGYRDTEVDAISLLALRMIFSLPFFVSSALLTSRKTTNIAFTKLQWAKIAFIGCLGYYISSLLDFLGLQYVSAGIERLILFIYPTLVLLMSASIFNQKIKPVQWLAIAITYGGLILAFYGELDFNHEQSNDFVWGAIMIFICAITYAAYIVGSGRLIPEVGAAKFNSYAMSFAGLGVLTHFFLTSDINLLQFPTEVYGYGIVMAIVSTVIPSYLVSEGIKRIGSSNAAIVGSVGPVSTIVQAYYFLDEPFLALQIVGTLLILLGVLVIGKK